LSFFLPNFLTHITIMSCKVCSNAKSF
jgi:hypothetical protein